MPLAGVNADSLFNALPMALMVADDRLNIVAVNTAAQESLPGIDPEVAMGQGPGHLLHCVHALMAGTMCGQSEHCKRCWVRKAGLAAIQEGAAQQREVNMTIVRNGNIVDIVLLVSASPLRSSEATPKPAAIIMVQDISQLHRLQGLIPICAHCKSIRRDDEAWDQLEKYVHENSIARFSHSICPNCRVKLYPPIP